MERSKFLRDTPVLGHEGQSKILNGFRIDTQGFGSLTQSAVPRNLHFANMFSSSENDVFILNLHLGKILLDLHTNMRWDLCWQANCNKHEVSKKKYIYIYNMPENSQNCSLATSTWARSLELASANDLVGAGGSKNCTENKAAARTRPATGMCWPFPNNGCGFESARMLNTWDGKLRKALRSHKSHEQGHEQGHARFTTLRV